jgi:hypothetical protein
MSNASYKLVKYSLAEGTGKYRAIVKHTETLTQEDLLDEMEWHSSTLTKADMLAFLEDHERTIIRALRKGKCIVTNLVHYKLTIKGNFDSEEDRLDFNRNEITATVSVGPVLRREITNDIPIEKQRSVKPRPRLDIYINTHKSDPNTVLTPTYMGRILGDQLRFEIDDPEEGLFLIRQTDGNSLIINPEAIRVEDISRLTTGEIIFRVPDDLLPGEYKLEVRARYGQNDIRAGELDELLMVL